MAIEWTPNLSVGVSSIDQQHKTLFDRANQLFEAGKNSRTKDPECEPDGGGLADEAYLHRGQEDRNLRE